MDNNKHQPQDEQSNVIPADFQQRINKVFGKALAAIIMTQIPLCCFISLFLGNNALKAANEIINLCSSYGIPIPGKLKTAKVLARVGKFVGLGFSIYYSISIVLFIINLISAFVSGGSAYFDFSLPIS